MNEITGDENVTTETMDTLPQTNTETLPQDEWPTLIIDCHCVMGLAGINHYPMDTCRELPVAEYTEERISDETELSMDEVSSIVKRGRGRPPKEDADLVDPVSAGRKRAAAKVQIKNQKCEWTYLAKAGGGVNPIVGCVGYPASALHHGPDKSTLNNSRPEDVGTGQPYNLHAICVWCHNRWHVANDDTYGDNGAVDRPEDNSEWVPLTEFALHDPNTTLEPIQVMMEETTRLKTEKKKGLDYSVDNGLDG